MELSKTEFDMSPGMMSYGTKEMSPPSLLQLRPCLQDRGNLLTRMTFRSTVTLRKTLGRVGSRTGGVHTARQDRIRSGNKHLRVRGRSYITRDGTRLLTYEGRGVPAPIIDDAHHSTADMYSQGLSEVMLGNAIKELKLNREDIVILTKARPAHPGLYRRCRVVVPEAYSCQLPQMLTFRYVYALECFVSPTVLPADQGQPGGWTQTSLDGRGARPSRFRQPARAVEEAHLLGCPGFPQASPGRLH